MNYVFSGKSYNNVHYVKAISLNIDSDAYLAWKIDRKIQDIQQIINPSLYLPPYWCLLKMRP